MSTTDPTPATRDRVVTVVDNVTLLAAIMWVTVYIGGRLTGIEFPTVVAGVTFGFAIFGMSTSVLGAPTWPDARRQYLTRVVSLAVATVVTALPPVRNLIGDPGPSLWLLGALAAAVVVLLTGYAAAADLRAGRLLASDPDARTVPGRSQHRGPNRKDTPR